MHMYVLWYMLIVHPFVQDLELPEDCKITYQLPSLKEATFLNCIGQSFIESVIDNAPALKKKVIEN